MPTRKATEHELREDVRRARGAGVKLGAGLYGGVGALQGAALGAARGTPGGAGTGAVGGAIGGGLLGAGVGYVGGHLVGKIAANKKRREGTEFMTKQTKARVILLNAKVKKVVNFARREDEESHGLRNTAIGAAGLAGAYGVGTAIRGYRRNQEFRGYGDRSVRGALDGFRTGHKMNMRDASDFAGRASDYFAGKAGAARSGMRNVTNSVRDRFRRTSTALAVR